MTEGQTGGLAVVRLSRRQQCSAGGAKWRWCWAPVAGGVSRLLLRTEREHEDRMGGRRYTARGRRWWEQGSGGEVQPTAAKVDKPVMGPRGEGPRDPREGKRGDSRRRTTRRGWARGDGGVEAGVIRVRSAAKEEEQPVQMRRQGDLPSTNPRSMERDADSGLTGSGDVVAGFLAGSNPGLQVEKPGRSLGP